MKKTMAQNLEMNLKMSQIINKLPVLDEWHSNEIIKKFGNLSWNNSIVELHKPENIGKYKDNFIKGWLMMKYFQLFQ